MTFEEFLIRLISVPLKSYEMPVEFVSSDEKGKLVVLEPTQIHLQHSYGVDGKYLGERVYISFNRRDYVAEVAASTTDQNREGEGDG